MTLRARLLAALAIVVAIVVLGAVLLIRTQGAYLTELVDVQLRSAIVPILRGPLSRPERTGPDRPRVPISPDTPISELFLGVVEDGTLVPLLRGQLLSDVPAVAIDAASLAALEAGGPATVDGADGASRFRVLVVRREGTEAAAVVALSMATVDAAVERLTMTLVAGTLVIVATLILVVWWVERLGLRPIARLTATAVAIAGGERGQRAVGADPRTEAGKLAGAFNVMLDERDEGEERLRRFVADASHELRTPLTSIRGYLELWRDGGFRDEGELGDVMRRMSQEATRMGELVEDLLLLARLDADRPLRVEEVDVGRLLEDAAQDARALQPARAIVVTAPAGGRLVIGGDRFRLQQVIGALVHNALRHTEVGVRIDLAAHREDERLLITVADAGPGIPPELAARVFDRFVRGEGSRSRQSGGAGLGLAIARSIVEAHGGTIELATRTGDGSRFTITLPVGSTAT